MKKLLILCLVSMGCKAQTTQLTPDEFEAKIKQAKTYIVLDVRTPQEYGNGHIDGATNIDFRNENFLNQAKVINKNKTVFVYCLSGGRSAGAAKALSEAGFKDIVELKGGMTKWLAGSKPTVQSEAMSKDLSKILTKAEFDKLIASDQPVLFDFFAPWCGPCQKMMPTILKLEKEYDKKAIFKTIDYDTNKELALSLGVDEIPMLLIYKKGKLVWRGIGASPEETLKKEIDKNL